MQVSGEGAARALEALLRAGGVEVKLRVPAPAAAGDDAEQLGLATPGFADVGLGRGLCRKTGSTEVVLLSARVLDRALAAQGAASAEALLAGSAGLWVGNSLLRIESCNALRAGNSVYGYLLTLADAVQ